MARVTLVEAQPWHAATGVAEPVRLAGGGRRHYRHKGQSDWLAGVISAPLTTGTMEFDGTFTGGGIATASAIGFMPAQAATRKRIASLVWSGAPIVVSIGDDSLADPVWEVIARGNVVGYSVQGSSFTFTIAVLAGRLPDPLVTATFAGTGGIEGAAQAAGRLKRRSWGRCWNVEGRLLDGPTNVYEFGDPAHPLAAIDQVKDKGRAGPTVMVGWTGSAAATLAALKAATAPQGGAAIAPSIACVKWWTQPSVLTADLRGEIGDVYVETVAGIAAAVSAAAGGPTVEDLAAAVAARPDPAGLHVGDAGETGVAALDRLLLRASMGWSVTPAGLLSLAPLAFADPVATVMAVGEAEREAAFAPVTSVSIGWRRNYRRHTSGEISAAVGDAVPWDDVTDPAGTKPEDNATVGAPPGTTVGGMPAEQVPIRLGEVDLALAASKARTAALETETIPAITGAAADANMRIAAARAQADKALADLGAQAGRLDRRIDSVAAAGGYDDTAVYAEVRRVSTAAADATKAVGDLSTSVTARFGGVSDTLSTYNQRITTLSTGQEGFASRASTLEAGAGRMDTALNGAGGVLARLAASDAAFGDLPNRYAAASRTRDLEAQVAGTAASGLGTSLTARIEERATAIADAKAGAVAQTVATLRSEYNGTVATVTQQAGTIVDVNYRTRSYWRTVAVAGNNRAQMTVYADDNNGAGVDIIGNLSVSGNLVVDGTIFTRAIAANAITVGVATFGADVSVSNGQSASTGSTTINATGAGSVRIDICYFDRLIGGGSSGTASIYIQRTSSSGVGSAGGSIVIGQHASPAPVTFWLLDTPPAGPVTYEIVVQSTGGDRTFYLQNPRVSVMEFKR